MAQSGYKTIRGFGTDEFVERKSPVSYTHLDVYKRQGIFHYLAEN